MPDTNHLSGASSYPFSQFVDPENEWDDGMDNYGNDTDHEGSGEERASEMYEMTSDNSHNRDGRNYVHRNGDFEGDTDSENEINGLAQAIQNSRTFDYDYDEDEDAVENGDNWNDADVELEYNAYWEMKDRYGNSLSPRKAWPPSRVIWLNNCLMRRGGLSLFSQEKIEVETFESHCNFVNGGGEETPRDPMCIICLEPFSTDQGVITLSCEHVYHLGCLRTWLRRSKNCPTCRGGIDPPAINAWREQQEKKIMAAELKSDLKKSAAAAG